MTDRTLPTNPPLPRAVIPAAPLEIIDSVFLFLLLLSCSTPYRIEIEAASITITEIGALVYILWKWLAGERPVEEPGRAVRWLKRGLWILSAWAGFLFLISSNWAMRGGMFLDWVLATLVLQSLLRSPWKDWKRYAVILVLAALPNAVLGAIQHMAGIGLAPKDFTGWSEGAAFFPVYGFFGHSNDLAVFLYWPFLICAGFIFLQRKWSRLLFAFLTVLFGLVLYWTVSRSTLLTLGVVAVILGLMYFLPRKKAFLIAMAVVLAAAVLLVAGIFLTQPLAQIDAILSGRLSLWSQALQVISGDPLYLPFGYLSIPTADLPVFYLPHNIYILAWIEFGWPGILLLIGMAIFFISGGVKRYAGLRLQPPAAILWVGLAGLFLINGMASLYFHEPYVFIYFMCITALWIYHLHEIDKPLPVPQTNDPALRKRIPAGKPVKTSAKKKKRTTAR